VNRLHTLHSALQDLNTASIRKSKETKSRSTTEASDAIVLRDANIVTPARVTLAAGVTVDVTPKSPLLVTGPNGSGKSAFYRVIAGLWQIGNSRVDGTGDGVVSSPDVQADGRPGIFLVPTKPYMPFGDLAFQLTYPNVEDVADEAAMARLQGALVQQRSHACVCWHNLLS